MPCTARPRPRPLGRPRNTILLIVARRVGSSRNALTKCLVQIDIFLDTHLFLMGCPPFDRSGSDPVFVSTFDAIFGGSIGRWPFHLIRERRAPIDVAPLRAARTTTAEYKSNPRSGLLIFGCVVLAAWAAARPTTSMPRAKPSDAARREIRRSGPCIPLRLSASASEYGTLWRQGAVMSNALRIRTSGQTAAAASAPCL